MFVAKILTVVSAVLVGAGISSAVMAQTALSTSAQTITPTAIGSITSTQTQTATGAGTTTFNTPTTSSFTTFVAPGSFTQFNTNTGILVGAHLGADVNYNVALSATGAGTGGYKVTVNSTVAASIAVNGGTPFVLGSAALSANCNGGDCANTSANNTVFFPSSTPNNRRAGTASAGGTLSAFTSNPQGFTFLTQITATGTTITNNATTTSGTATTTTSLTSNSYSLTYDYLNFSTPSFTTGTQTTSATANIGTVFRGSTATQSFNVTNIAAAPANTSPTSLTGVTGGNAGVTTTLTSLSNLAAGQTSGAFTVGLNTSTVGAKSGTFTYVMTDTPTVGGVAVSGAAGMRTTNLTQNVTGTVVDRASPSFSTAGVVTTTTANFGNVYRDAGNQTSSALTLANNGGAAAVNAVLNSVTTSGGFTTTLANGLQVAAGTPQSFTTSFNPNAGVSGSRSGSVLLVLSDVTTGMASGTTASSYNLTLNTNATVWDHANPQFAATQTGRAQTINFGTVFAGSTATSNFALTNVADAGTNRVATSLNSVNTAGAGNFSTNLAPLSSLAAGSTTSNYTASFNSATRGQNNGTFVLNMADVAPSGGIAGAGSNYQLSLNATANVVDRASPSFSTAGVVTTTTANFGNVYRDAGNQTSSALTLANNGGAAAVNAVLNSVTTSGGFTTTLANGLQVAAGTPQSFTTSFNPNAGVSGSRSGSVLLVLSDVTTGMASGTTASSYNLTLNTNATVWDHANPQFAATQTGRAQTINFGTVFAGSTATSNFALTNVADAGTNRVATSLNSVNTAGAGNFSTNLAPLSSLAAGSTTSNYTASFNSATRGQNNGAFVLNMADVAPSGGIAGAGSNYQLSLNATANVINYANPSFNGSTVETSKTLNFGTVSSRGGPVSLNFSLFNIGDANSAGLELFQIDGPGNVQFSSNVSPFLNLAGGGFSNYTVNLNPLTLGAANGLYTFLFRDHAPGVSGVRQYSLNLTLAGNVFDPVPEPGTWMMMMLGFGLVGAVARRRAAVRT